jgi:hypothetical protein
VFAGLGGVDGDKRVPVVRGGDHHGVEVRVGQPAKPCTTLPDTLHFGTNTLPGAGAGCQPVKVSVRCSVLARSLPAGDVSFCSVTMVDGRPVIHVMGGQPLGARVTITGPATSTRPKVSLSRVYFVRG